MLRAYMPLILDASRVDVQHIRGSGLLFVSGKSLIKISEILRTSPVFTLQELVLPRSQEAIVASIVVRQSERVRIAAVLAKGRVRWPRA